jgi:hypothetical protein
VKIGLVRHTTTRVRHTVPQGSKPLADWKKPFPLHHEIKSLTIKTSDYANIRNNEYPNT